MPRRRPTVVVIDDFLEDPRTLLHLAERVAMRPEPDRFKGVRSSPYRDPAVRAIFEEVLGAPIVDWGMQPYNGSFQRTGPDDPIVWHADSQSYAAALYLSPTDPAAGTSFWRHRTTQARRSPWHPQEFYWSTQSPEERQAAHDAMFNDHNFVHPEPWELVDQVGGVWNRCVIWDAKLIHSATSYPFDRLVQLFFFTLAEAA